MNKIELKMATAEELGIALALIDEAKHYLKKNGVDQWQNGYPDEECIKKDIQDKKGYFLISENKILGYLCIDFDGEPAYSNIDGTWLSNHKYAVVHRMAIDNKYKGKGLSSVAFDLVEEKCKKKFICSIRVDTNRDNKLMQHIIRKNGFQFCGTVNFDNSSKDAFEKII